MFIIYVRLMSAFIELSMMVSKKNTIHILFLLYKTRENNFTA